MPKLALTAGPRWRNRSITYRLMVSCSVPDLENALVGNLNSFSEYSLDIICSIFQVVITFDCVCRDGRDFAVQMFDSLARKRGIVKEVLTKAELKEFWVQLSDQGFDNLFQTSINMLVVHFC